MMKGLALVLIFILPLAIIASAETPKVPFPKILWAFWDNGLDNVGLFTKLCVNNMIHYANTSNWEFRFLTKENATKYISKQSNARIDKLMKTTFYQLRPQHYADIMRLFLLYEHGGFWVDTNTVFINTLSWVQHIEKETDIVNKIGNDPDYIGFSYDYYGKSQTTFDEQLKTKIKFIPGLEIWAFIAKPQAKFLKDVIENLQYTFSKPNSQIITENVNQHHYSYGWQRSVYFITSNFQFSTVLQKKQEQINANPSKFTVKYAVQYYNLWTIRCQQSALSIFIKENQSNPKIFEALTHRNLDEYLKTHKLKRYFFKFIAGQYVDINRYMQEMYTTMCTRSSKRFQENSIINQELFRYSNNILKVKRMKILNALDKVETNSKTCTMSESQLYPISFPKILWLYSREDIDQNHLFTTLCLNNVKYYAKKSNWELRFITSTNISKLLSPQSTKRIDSMKTSLSNELSFKEKQDIYKLFLLYENGGMLLDVNSFFVNDFSWIEKINEENVVINKKGSFPELLSFTKDQYTNDKTKRTINDLGQQLQLTPGFQLSPMISLAKSTFLRDVLENIQTLLERQLLLRKSLSFNTEAIAKSTLQMSILQKIFQTVLQNKQTYIEQNVANFTTKYAVQFYKIWSIKSELTIGALLQSTKMESKQIIDILMHRNLKEFVLESKAKPFFFQLQENQSDKMTKQINQLYDRLCSKTIRQFSDSSIMAEYLFRYSQQLTKISRITVLNQRLQLQIDSKLCKQPTETWVFPFTKTIWAYSDSKSTDLFNQLCINNVQHYAKLNHWQLIILNQNSFSQYLSLQAQKRISKMKDTPFYKLSQSQLIAIYKLFIIEENGGMWIDKDTLLTNSLDRIEHINLDKNIAFKSSDQPEFVAFSHNKNGQIIVSPQNSNANLKQLMISQILNFISVPNSRLLRDFINNLEYSLSKSPIDLKQENLNKGIKNHEQILPDLFTWSYQMQILLHNQQIQMMNKHFKVQTNSSIQYYKMWMIQPQSTLYQPDLSSLLQTNSQTNSYFLKVQEGQSSKINEYLAQLPQLLCTHRVNKIEQNSLMSQYVFKYSLHLQQIAKIVKINTVEARDIAQVCLLYKAESYTYNPYRIAFVLSSLLLLALGIRWKLSRKSKKQQNITMIQVDNIYIQQQQPSSNEEKQIRATTNQLTIQ